MKYDIIEAQVMGEIQKHIILRGNAGSFESFPADPENPRYQQFLETLEGNEPEVIDG